MNQQVLHKEVQAFILENLSTDISRVLLKGSPFSDVTIQEIAEQIVGKTKAQKKLPSWFSCQYIYYPPKLNLEQTSSEITATYKSTLVHGNSCIDLTGGFGIDSYYFSKEFKEVIHCEVNSQLSQISKHNATQLNANNIEYVNSDGLEYLKNYNKKYDCIFIDPSRRNEKKGKVFLLEDCIPNVPENIEFLFQFSNIILVKYSPMLDIQIGINSLKYVKEVHIVAIENEVKELLFLLEKDYLDTITIKTINHSKKGNQKFHFTKDQQISNSFSLPLSYLYEPNSAILKSGGFSELTQQFTLDKLHQHSHLYTSKKLIDFPGRIFKIEKVMEYNKSTIKSITKLKANITTRNFPLTVNQLKKKLKLKDGGDVFMFFTTNLNNQLIVIECKKAVIT